MWGGRQWQAISVDWGEGLMFSNHHRPSPPPHTQQPYASLEVHLPIVCLHTHTRALPPTPILLNTWYYIATANLQLNCILG